jgi:hypothetical protein
MQITVETPFGPRSGVSPHEGIADEDTLIKSLILTLARECNAGAGDVRLNVDCADADPHRLVAVAKGLGIGWGALG